MGSLLTLLRRRAFSPTSISGLALWLDASRISGLVDGDPVATWSDLSGLGNHATQATEAKKPTYKTAIQNGKPVVRFDGVDDVITSTGVALTQPDTLFLVAKNLGATGAKDFVDGVGGRHLIQANAAGTVFVYAGAGYSPAAVPANWNVYAVRWNGVSSILNVNGGANLTGNAGTDGAPGLCFGSAFTGGAEFANADIAEVIAYRGGLTAGQVTQVSTFLRAKWGLP